MKSKLLLVSQAVAAAIAVSAFVAPASATPLPNNFIAAPIVANIPGTSDDGVICRTGYTPSFTATTMKCSKAEVVTVVLECLNPLFPTYLIRAKNGNVSDGKDLCTKAGVVITSTGSLNGLTLDRDYAFATINASTITNRTGNRDHQEAVALGLADNEVDTLAGTTTIVVDRGVGAKDNADLPLTLFTLPIVNRGGFGGFPVPLAR